MADSTSSFRVIGKEATLEFMRNVFAAEAEAINAENIKRLLVLRIEHGSVVPHTIIGAMSGFDAMQYLMSHLPCQVADIAGDLIHKCLTEALDAVVPPEHKEAVAAFLTKPSEKKEHQH